TLTLYQMSIMTLCTAGLLTFGFRAPHWRDALMVALAGVGNGIAQLWWTRSLSLAPPSAVVPFNYLSLVWATILGFAGWGDVPTPGLLVGSAIVVASGLYILWRETLRRRPAVPTPAWGTLLLVFRGDEAGCGVRHVDQRPSGIGLSARRKAIAGSAAVTAASSST